MTGSMNSPTSPTPSPKSENDQHGIYPNTQLRATPRPHWRDGLRPVPLPRAQRAPLWGLTMGLLAQSQRSNGFLQRTPVPTRPGRTCPRPSLRNCWPPHPKTRAHPTSASPGGPCLSGPLPPPSPHRPEEGGAGGTPNAVIFAREREEHRRPACFGRRAAWFQKVHREECQSPHGRDGHAPFFCAAILTSLGGTLALHFKSPNKSGLWLQRFFWISMRRS
jgi:hypothetical protein